MTRYLRLYLRFVQFAVSRSMEFRLDFFFRIVMDLVFYAVNLGFFRVLYLHTPRIGGWTEQQAMVFVGMYLVVDAIHMTVFSSNMWWFPMLVNKGDLDYYLVRPVSTLFFVSLRDFAFNSLINLLFALGILGWAIARLPGGFSTAQWLLLAPLLVFGTVLYYVLHMIFMLPVFWTHSQSGLRSVYYGLSRISERPDRIFQGWMWRLLVSILPFCLVASLPARLLVEPFSWKVLSHMVIVFAVFWAILLLLWNRALRSYSSASS